MVQRAINVTYLVHSRNANASIQCPVAEGKYTVTHTVDLPKEIPPGMSHTYYTTTV